MVDVVATTAGWQFGLTLGIVVIAITAVIVYGLLMLFLARRLTPAVRADAETGSAAVAA